MAIAPAIVGGLGFLGNLFGGESEYDQFLKEQGRYNEAIKELEGMETPSYIQTPELQQYQIPEALEAQLIEEDPFAREQMVSSLENLRRLREEGMDPRSARAYEEARRRAGGAARGRTGAAIQDLEARGMGTSGLRLLAQLKGSQDVGEDISMSGLAQAEEEARMREQANRDMLTGAGALRGQDINVAGSNADIINRFNQENSRVRNEMINKNIALRNLQMQEDAANKRAYQQEEYQRALDKARMKSGYGEQLSGAERARNIAGTERTRGLIESGAKFGGALYGAMSQPSSPQLPKLQPVQPTVPTVPQPMIGGNYSFDQPNFQDYRSA